MYVTNVVLYNDTFQNYLSKIKLDVRSCFLLDCSTVVRYNAKTVKSYQLSLHVGNIKRCWLQYSTKYTSHCLLNDAGMEFRHIMFVSSHRNQFCNLCSMYNRYRSTQQKCKMSNVGRLNRYSIVSE